MENDSNLTVKKSANFLIKCGSDKFTLNSENKEVLNMESINNRTNLQHASQTSTSSSGKGITTTNSSTSPKMGSRRIFTPQFKLQVLESYRNDNDCKGNQRATARKYNIHRRQIQKWLQCEPSLRSSVANINHNSVKHQFHNVSMQQQSKNIAITSHCSGSSSSYTSSQLHPTHSCLDSSRGSLNAIKVPSLSSCVNTSSTLGTHDNIFDAANLAAAVAAAAKGSIEISSSSDPIQEKTSISPLLHHHHFGIPPYCSNMPSDATVPILAHTHLSNPQPHMCQQNHLPNQTSYQLHQNMTYSPTLSHHHHQTEKQQSSYFTPVINLPIINALSAVASTPTNYAGGDNEIRDKIALDLISMGTKTYRKFESDSPYYESNDSTGAINTSNMNNPFSINQFKEDLSYSTAYPFVPIDLSLPHRREEQSSELVVNEKSSFQNTENKQLGTFGRKEWNGAKIDVVDLTYRKRKILNMPNENRSEFAEKHAKFSNEDVPPITSVSQMTINSPNSTDEDDIEIEVGIEEKFQSPSCKPVKLFKPYLLDECDNKFNKYEHSEEQLETISTSCFSNSILTTNNSSNDISTRGNTFPYIVKESINTTCLDSSNFLVESRSESPRSSCSPATSVLTISPRNFQYPKGSPASSGYESSTSTYSDSSSLSSKHELYTYGQTYNINLQMQTIYNENAHVLHPSKHVQRWLEKDDSKSLTTNSSIALLA